MKFISLKTNIPGTLALYYRVRNTRRFKTALKILLEIALNETMSQYNLPQKSEDSYRTVLRHIKILKKLKFIKLDHTEPSSKKGKEKNIWKVTFSGLMRLLIEKEMYTHIDIFAKNYPQELPLVFGRWEFFAQNHIKNQIIHNLAHIPSIIESQIIRILIALDVAERQTAPAINRVKQDLLALDKSLRDRLKFIPDGDPEKDELAHLMDEETSRIPFYLNAMRNFDDVVARFVGSVENTIDKAKEKITFHVFTQAEGVTDEELVSLQSILRKDEGINQLIGDEIKKISHNLEQRNKAMNAFLSWWIKRS